MFVHTTILLMNVGEVMQVWNLQFLLYTVHSKDFMKSVAAVVVLVNPISRYIKLTYVTGDWLLLQMSIGKLPVGRGMLYD